VSLKVGTFLRDSVHHSVPKRQLGWLNLLHSSILPSPVTAKNT